jgi:hypothetical protein
MSFEEVKLSLPIVRVSLDLTPGGIRRLQVYFETDEQRDEAITRLNRCLPQIALLEQALQGTAESSQP